MEGRDVRIPGMLGALTSSTATFLAVLSPNISTVAVFYGIVGIKTQYFSPFTALNPSQIVLC